MHSSKSIMVLSTNERAIIAAGANSQRARLMSYLWVSPDEMRLPKKTKWVKKKNERPKGWQTCFGRLRGKGWCSCLLNGATLHTPDEWTGGGADISTVIYHPARPARKPTWAPPHGPTRRRTRTENREREETRKRELWTRSVLRCTLGPLRAPGQPSLPRLQTS